MAALDTALYPLSSETSLAQIPAVSRDVFSDGSLYVRAAGSDAAEGQLVFAPMTLTVAESFEAYFRANRAAEISVTYNGSTYDGYFWGDLEADSGAGQLVTYRVNFRGVVSGA